MKETDYIMRMLEHFFELLTRLFNNKRANEEYVQNQIDHLYTDFFHESTFFFYQKDADEIIIFLKTSYPIDFLKRIEMLAELFYNEVLYSTNPNFKSDLSLKALTFYQLVECESKVYSSERLMYM